MRVVLRSLVILMIILAMIPLAQTGAAAAQPEVVNTGDELVVITAATRLRAADPYTPPGFQPVVWESPVDGFTNVTTGDFDGDGSAEVVGLRGTQAIIYDPVRRPGEPNTTATFNATAGQVWLNVVTGDFDGDGADEVLLVEPSGSGAWMYAYRYTSTSWSQIFSSGPQGSPWQALATGDVMGNGRDQVVGLRNFGSSYQILIFDPANSWQLIHAGTGYGFPWVTVAVGNVNNDSANQDEIVVTRRDAGVSFASFFVFRWVAGTSGLQVVAEQFFNPWFQRIALGDVNASGDDEIFLLRYNQAQFQPALANFNLGGDPAIAFNELIGQLDWNGLQAGDVDADGKDEVIVMSVNEYLIYTQPDVSTAVQRVLGSFSPTGNFAVGNLDGPGVAATPTLSVTPLTINRTVQAGQTVTDPITIANTGGGTLNWTATVIDGSSWLSVSPASGTAPATPQLSINTSGLAPAPYVGRVRIDAPGANGSPKTVTVNLTVTAAPPTLSVSPLTVDLTLQAGQNASEFITISNSGGGALSWTATVVDGSSWLSMSPASGAAPSTPQLQVNTSGLAPGPYIGRVRIDAPGVNGSPQTITVNLTVTAPPNPILTVSPLTVDVTLQAGQSASEPITIGNSGAGTLNWTATVVDGSSWLSLSPASGTAPSTPQLRVNTSSLAPAQYVGRVRIDAPGANGSPQTITVNLTVTAPQFSVQPGSVSWFYQPPANPGVRSASISGQNVAWHAGVVPTSAAARVEQAIAAGQPIKLQDGRLLIGEGENAEEVPIVDWIDVNPVTGVATPGGIFVDLRLVLDRVPYGLNTAAVVFVADTVASPPAVVVRASALRSQPNGEDLLFLPLVMRGS